jgi:hypothetical protein
MALQAGPEAPAQIPGAAQRDVIGEGAERDGFRRRHHRVMPGHIKLSEAGRAAVITGELHAGDVIALQRLQGHAAIAPQIPAQTQRAAD